MSKERLVELLEEAEYEFLCNVTKCSEMEYIADYLLANGVIVPPCKVGDEVYYLHEMCNENGDEYFDISEGKCEGISLQKDGLWMYCRYDDGLTYWHKSDKLVFLTREEAEAKLREGAE